MMTAGAAACSFCLGNLIFLARTPIIQSVSMLVRPLLHLQMSPHLNQSFYGFCLRFGIKNMFKRKLD